MVEEPCKSGAGTRDAPLVDMQTDLETELLLEEEAEDEAEYEDVELAQVKDTGELYGVRVPHAGDTDLTAPEDQDAYAGAENGENWIEALEEHATETGPVPEEEVVVIDDSDELRGHSPTENTKRHSVADKGSGGIGGV
ncbi:MAG: hypothetical protein KF773_37760 [Deltaproteobacteria bacterium]|nr:hypothetical protein [Deltaproteobacteria bacterium]MCW5802353.1 hypothetical protein [Deltaproteobacteria bacterium]